MANTVYHARVAYRQTPSGIHDTLPTIMKNNKLKYDQRWFEYGILTKEEYAKQIELFNLGRDTNTEHYRYKSFVKYIDSKEVFIDKEIFNLTELIQMDEDINMSGSVMKHLIESDKLSVLQYLTIKQEFLKYGDWAKRKIDEIENPNNGLFNDNFCEHLEVRINELIGESKQGEMSKWWCDGIAPVKLSIKLVKEKRETTTRIWIGKDGQNEYPITVKLGQIAMEKISSKSDLIDSIPESALDSWLHLNQNEKCFKLELK